MNLRHLLILSLVAGLTACPPVLSLAADADDEEAAEAPVTGFEKPYAAERESLGFDPEGVEYHQNRLEDFQIIFITSAPFTALFSYGITGLVSKIDRGTFKVSGGYSKAFLIGTLAGAFTIATYSVYGSDAASSPSASLPPPPRTLAHAGPRVTILDARF